MNDILKYNFINQLKKLPKIQTIWLFGSRARKDHNEKSDIDLAISCSNASENDWLEINEIIENADTLLKIDIINFDKLKQSSPLKESILKQGIKIYEKL